MWVRLVVVFGVWLEPVIKAAGVILGVDCIELRSGHHFSQIPQLHVLVLAIGKHISTITFAIDVCQSFRMSDEHTGFTSVTH